MFWQLTGQAEAPTTRWESRSQTALHRRPNPPRRRDALKRGTWGLLVSPRIDKRQLTSRTMVHINMPASEKVCNSCTLHVLFVSQDEGRPSMIMLLGLPLLSGCSFGCLGSFCCFGCWHSLLPG